MQKKRSVGLVVAFVIIVILSLLASIYGYLIIILNFGQRKPLLLEIAFATVQGIALEGLNYFRVHHYPIAHILDYLILWVFTPINVLWSFFLLLCGIFLFLQKSWARRFFLVYSICNIILSIFSYGVRWRYSLIREGQINAYFILLWVLPVLLHGYFIYFLTRPHVKEQFR